MARADKVKNNKGKKVSVWNWMGTLILLGIPGVNIIALILFLIFSKAQAKRSFLIAYLVLGILAVVLVCAVFLAFPEQLSELATLMRGTANDPAVFLP